MKMLAILLTLATPSFAHETHPLIEEAASADLVRFMLEKGSEFKKQGLWNDHIKFGEQAIALCQKMGLLEEEAELSTQIASTYFYRGDFERIKTLSEKSLNIYRQIEKTDGVIASLYLLSAAERGLKNYPSAIETAEEALSLCMGENYLKAKVLFNLAAALSDQEAPVIEKALDHLNDALVLFRSAEDDDYVGRTVLRIARLHILQNEPQLAIDVLQDGISHIHQDRVWMHYHYLMAQALRKLGMEDAALQELRIAKVLALRLEANEDLARIEMFLDKKG